MTGASGPSISGSARRGFRNWDIPDRISYIMSEGYIKHGFTQSNKTLNYTAAKQNNNLFCSFWCKKYKTCAWPYIAFFAALIYFPLLHQEVQRKCMIIKIINKLSLLPIPKYYYVSEAWRRRRRRRRRATT